MSDFYSLNTPLKPPFGFISSILIHYSSYAPFCIYLFVLVLHHQDLLYCPCVFKSLPLHRALR